VFAEVPSSGNFIYHNNLIGNIWMQAYTVSGAVNFWDDGYPSGGNYWSDYTGVDANGDGIGDTPYIIDADNIDHYPLMKPWAPTLPAPPSLNATFKINPKALNLRSRGRWITAYIELPEGYNVSDINVSTVLLNGTVQAESRPIGIGDEDGDGIPDLMVKFSRAEVISYILANVDVAELFERRFMTITLTTTGCLNDGTPFQGSCNIKIIMPMPRGLYRIFPI
jgi:hypothetical protein